MNILESEKYTAFMFIAISLVTLLILFNFVNIFEENTLEENIIEEKKMKNRLTGFVIYDESNESLDLEDKQNTESRNSREQQEELYSEKSYFIYYMILIILGVGIFSLAFRYFLPFIKEHS